MSWPFTLLCSMTVAASAFLVFLLEPMFAKMVLPLLGGAANVWIAATMFYQVALLIGYLYAHVSSFLPLRLQWPLHGLLGLAALLVLPVAVPHGWTPPGDGNPAPALFLMMAGAIGAPFVVLSASASLAQRWFALARPRENPYSLYAISNAGSFVALIAYPLVVEPHFSLSAQAHDWSYGYAAVVAALFLVGGIACRAPAPGLATAPAAPEAPIPARLVLRWILLAAVPSSLLLSFTSFLTVDVGSLPLLWVLVLALYLATFIIAFSGKSETFGAPARLYYPIFMVGGCIGLTSVFTKVAPTSAPMMAVYLACYVAAAMGCHSELARLKPSASRLTFFFLAVSLGGALGGMFNSLLAPRIFTDIVEFPLGLVLAGLLIRADAPSSRGRNYAIAALAAGLVVLAISWPEPADPEEIGYVLTYRGLLAAATLALIFIRSDRRALAAGVAACLGVALCLPSSQRLVFAERNFYGVNRVRDLAASDLRRMEHGDTIHGLLALDSEHRLTPLGYYNPKGGLAQSALALNLGRPEPKIALVGLGAGEMVCIGGQDWRYDIYEIDPGVIRIASDAALFPFLRDCAASHRIIQGDGRLRLRSAPDGEYDQIIVDAFTSDAIPTHLLTREALAEYMAKLKPDGVLTLHLSNRYFNLAPVVEAEARDLGLSSLGHLSPGSAIGPSKLPVFPTLAVNLSRDASRLAPLAAAGWRRLRPVAGSQGWTDNWSNVLGALMWSGAPTDPFEDVAELRGPLAETD